MELKFISVRIKKNLIDICIHFLVSFAFALIIYSVSGSLKYSSIFFLSGIFIDLDHFIDHFLFFKDKFSIKDFFGNTYLDSGKIYIWLHSWELIALMLLTGLFVKSLSLSILSFSFAIHLLIDNIQRRNLFCYFLIYRIIKKFDIRILFPELDLPEQNA